jgi:hypothetical protein
MRAKPLHLVLIAIAVTLAWTARTAWIARQDLVTLDVRDMDVAKVVRKIERQTWETILLQSGVTGRVTLKVSKAPLEPVLELVAGQVTARSAHVYPIYRDKSRLKALQHLIRSHSPAEAPASQWTNFAFRGRIGGGPRGGGLEGSDAASSGITLSLQDKEPGRAALTVGYAVHGLVVPEDGIDTKVSLSLTNASPEEAVQKFAKAVFRNYDSFYVIQPSGFGRGPGPGEFDEDRMREQREARMDAMSPEQKARMEEMRNLSPEERRAVMQARMEDPAVQQRMVDRMLNDIRTSTPEQIVQRQRQRRQMRNAFQQQGPPGDPGQPGRPAQ